MMKPAASPRITRTVEILLLIAIVVVAIIFRFAYFKQIPPGLHYDEAFDARLAQQIRAGAWPIYFEEGWGREPLYHYLVAFTLNLISDPTTALRFVSGVLGLIQLLAAYLLYRRLFGVPEALIGAAWIAVTFWTVSTSRAGLRNITLTALTTLTALAFWSVWSRGRGARGEGQEISRTTPHAARFAHYLLLVILAGILLGLTLYTYQPSRVVPLIFVAFAIYLAMFHRASIKANWKSLVIFLAVATIIALPLITFLATHPNAETGRAFQTEPIDALLHGDPSQVIGTTAATLKMFTFNGGGDPQPLYNVSGRPLFIGLGSLLFYIGLIVSLVRFKRPAYTFMLMWLIITLLPNMVTAPAPFFYRAIAAQTAVLVMPAIGTVAIGDLFQRGGAESGRNKVAIGLVVAAVIALASLGQTAVTTWHDYFGVWGNDPEVRFQYSAAHTAIAHALDASSEATPVAVSGYFVEDADPIIFDQTLNRRDLSLRWFDARDALVAAANARTQRIATPSFTPLDEQLKSRFIGSAAPITSTKDFKLYSFDADRFRAAIDAWDHCANCPVTFNDEITLIGLERPLSIAAQDGTLTIFSAWRVLREGQPSATKIFIHLLDATGQIAAQDDRLGVPRHTWQPGDEFVQLHRIPIATLPPGTYTLEVGVYNRDDGVRWSATGRSGQAIGDHVLLSSIEVQP
jgi:4-amino-4-deoxy-L-arabinose transferase-like glycosyltransferase